MGNMATLKFDNINKVYDNGVHAVYDFNLNIEDKEFVVFVGPSGCGKSTTLRMVAGLEEMTSGTLYIDDKIVNEVLPKDRDIAMVFQNYALYPHMTVYKNMAFGLKLRKMKKEEIDKRVQFAAQILGLTEYLDRKPKALSGGQRQRVALGRAIVRSPKVFLMDEPLSNLDAKLRVQMRTEITRIHKAVGATTIYVTHDQTEAMTMADRVVVMKDGYIQQIGTPREIYSNPSNIFVATFIGAPAMNILHGEYDNGVIRLSNGFEMDFGEPLIKKHDDFYEGLLKKYQADKEEIEFDINDIHKDMDDPSYKKKMNSLKKELAQYEEKLEKCIKQIEITKECLSSKKHYLLVGIRPEDIYPVNDNGNASPSKPITVVCNTQELLGRELIIYGKINEDKIIIKTNYSYNIQNDQPSDYCFDLDKVIFFDGESGGRIL